MDGRDAGPQGVGHPFTVLIIYPPYCGVPSRPIMQPAKPRVKSLKNLPRFTLCVPVSRPYSDWTLWGMTQLD